MNTVRHDSQLVDLLQQLGRRHREHAMSVIADFDLTLPLAGALHHLEEPCQMGNLADRLSCDASYVTGLADRLEARGLAERRPDPSDRRVKELVLTEAGRTLHTEIRSALRDAHPLLQNLDSDEQATLATLLHKALA